jgi:Ca2+-binding RTX toxin-like protein
MIERLEQRCLLSAGIKGSVVVQTGDGDQALAGVTVFLDADNDGVMDSGEVSVVSDATGTYEFTNLAPGLYRVREVVPREHDLISFKPQVEVEDTFIGNGGTLINVHYWKINGTAGPDVITAGVDPLGAKVTVNGVAEVRSLSGLTGLQIRAKGGNDQITIDSQLQILTKIFADSGNDIVTGGGGPDSIVGGRGADLLKGGGGDDSIFGQGEADRIYAGNGDDSVDGGSGANLIHGGAGDDDISAGSGAAAGRATVYGDAGNDSIMGSQRNDLILGGAGDDALDGWLGSDKLYGGDGKDRIDSTDRGDRDLVDGGAGRDMAWIDWRDDLLGIEKVLEVWRP